MKNLYAVILLVIVASFMSMGCVTTSVWEENKINRKYNDVIRAFVIVEETGKTAFLGDKYHYIFEKNEKFDFIYSHKNECTNFDVLSGNYTVDENHAYANFPVHLTKSCKDNLITQWFKENQDARYPNKVWINFRGERYLADQNVNNHVQKLSQDFNLTITEKVIVNKQNEFIKILKTPFAVAADGAIIAVTVAGIAVVAVVAIPTMLVSDIVKPKKR